MTKPFRTASRLRSQMRLPLALVGISSNQTARAPSMSRSRRALTRPLSSPEEIHVAGSGFCFSWWPSFHFSRDHHAFSAGTSCAVSVSGGKVLVTHLGYLRHPPEGPWNDRVDPKPPQSHRIFMNCPRPTMPPDRSTENALGYPLQPHEMPLSNVREFCARFPKLPNRVRPSSDHAVPASPLAWRREGVTTIHFGYV